MYPPDLQQHRRERLQAAIERRCDGNVTSFGRLIGYKDGAFVRQMLAGERAVTEKTVEKIEAQAGLAGWFSVDEPGARSMFVAESHTPYGSTVSLPLFSASASMGAGDDVHPEDIVVGRLTLSADWIHRTLKPARMDALSFLHAYGDSMKPTFANGDILLVDRSVTAIRIDGVYVLSAHQRLFVKRVRQRLDGTYEISSDNPTVKTTDVLDGNGDHDVQVLGRVVWAWAGVEL